MGRHEKFSPPTFNLELVPRGRLIEAIRASIAGNTVTLVTAPTGSGKSALMAQVLDAWRGRGGEAAWFGCDHFDAEAGRFVSMLEQAVAGCHGDGRGHDEGVEGDRTTIEALLSAHDPKGLADAIVSRGRRIVFFIDNFHLCDSEETAHALDVLIREGRGLVHAVIGARRGVRLALGHLRLRGLVGEFDAGDLAFSPEEARRLIGHDCRADADAVERVIRRTEGWAAGLQLVRLLVAAGASLRQLAQEFSGADQDIGQFLNEEVFRTLPPPLRDFLLRVGPLDNITAELSEAVTGDGAARDHFHDMQERNLFVMRLDRHGSQIRLHALFRDFLIMQAQRQDPALVARSLRRAALWHHGKGDWIEAIDYAFRAGEGGLAADWLEACAPELLTRRGETARFLSCAERLPPADPTWPRIAFWMAWAALFSGDYDRAGQIMDAHVETLRRQDPQGRQLGLLRFLIAYFTHRHGDALVLGRDWLEGAATETPFDRATVAVAMALCQRGQIDMAGALKSLDLARREIARANTSYGLGWVTTLSALFFLLQGRPEAACKEIEEMLARNQPSELMRASAELVLADACYERGQLDQARLLIRRSLPSIAQHGNIDIALCGWRVAARLALIDKGPEAALDLLRDMEPLSIRRFGAPALRMLHLIRNEIILDLGPVVRRGLDIADGGDPGDAAADTPELAERQRLLNAKQNLVSGHARRAIADILPIVAATRASGRLRLWVQACCVKAAAHHADGETTFALRTLVEAVEKAASLGLARSILDHEAILRPLAPAIAQHVASIRDSLPAEVLALVAQWAGTPPPAPDDDDEDAAASGDAAARASLSKKEYRVLAMVSQGLTNGQITERLFVSLPTVKWHLRNIFDKLDVRTRTAAVAKARSMGMLQ